MFLQSDSAEVNLLRVRQLFDGLIQENPRLRHHLSASADIVHDKAFESGIVKLQRRDGPTREEANALQVFKLSDDVAEADSSTSTMGFVERILHAQDDAQKCRKVVLQYRSTAHVSPTRL